MLRNNLVQKYTLDPLKTWDIVDRDKDLCLLGGFYAGTILSTEEYLIIPWELDQWIIERISEPLVTEVARENILETYRGGTGRRRRNHPIVGATVPQPYRSTEFLIPHPEQKAVPKGGLIQAFPEGPIVRLWEHQGNLYLSSRTKLHAKDIFETIMDELDKFKIPSMLIVSLPEFSISMRKEMNGVYDFSSLKKLSLREANNWMGFSSSGDWRISDGESCLVTFDNGDRTLLKPNAKVWREAIVTGNSFPDTFILALSIKDVQNDLYSRFINLTSVGSMDNKTYEDFWPLISSDIDKPYQKISNTYYCLLRSLPSNRITDNFYQKWFGTEPFTDFTNQILSFSPEKDSASEAKLQVTRSSEARVSKSFTSEAELQVTRSSEARVSRSETSDLESLILKIWKEIKDNATRNKFLLKISKLVLEEEGDPWTNFLQIFIFSPFANLDGIRLNKLRKMSFVSSLNK